MPYLKLLRPLQWIKNIFVFVPAIFARELFVTEVIVPTFFAALVFCLAASAMYIVNDLFDREQDRLHPQKKFRPLASGAIPVSHASILCALLCVTALYILWRFVPSIALPVVAYVLLNLAYSSFLKHVAIVELLIVSFFYLLRIVAGGFATSTFISGWLVLCVIFLTFFMAVGKRFAESSYDSQRKVLRFYPTRFLEQLLGIAAGLTITSYGIYTVLGVKSELMVYSIFFVLLGVFRYFQLIYSSSLAETPEQALVRDKMILYAVAGWSLFVGYIFYFS